MRALARNNLRCSFVQISHFVRDDKESVRDDKESIQEYKVSIRDYKIIAIPKIAFFASLFLFMFKNNRKGDIVGCYALAVVSMLSGVTGPFYGND